MGKDQRKECRKCGSAQLVEAEGFTHCGACGFADVPERPLTERVQELLEASEREIVRRRTLTAALRQCQEFIKRERDSYLEEAHYIIDMLVRADPVDQRVMSEFAQLLNIIDEALHA